MNMKTDRRAFTLLELLVVIVIIAVLVGLVAGAGVAVLGNRKVKLTEDILSTLDRALTDYMISNGGNAPNYMAEQYFNTPGTGYHPNSAATNTSSNSDAWTTLDGVMYPRHPDAAVFLRSAQGFGAVDAILEGLGDRWLIATPQPAIVPTPPPGSLELNSDDGTPSVLDAWADPRDWIDPWPVLGITTIYYVHPDNELAQRLYGRCVGGRPYFFSAGPDGLYGTTTQFSPDGVQGGGSDPDAPARAENALGDNVYSYTPGAADLTQSFRDTYR